MYYLNAKKFSDDRLTIFQKTVSKNRYGRIYIDGKSKEISSKTRNFKTAKTTLFKWYHSLQYAQSHNLIIHDIQFNKLMKKILILLVMLFSTSVSSLARGAENYEDCILENMKGGDVAAYEIKDACKEKHINTIFSICVETDAQDRDGIIYLPNKTKPFTGKNLCKHINGQVKSKGEIKDGKNDGKWIWWYENGQKGLEKNYKHGKLDGKVIWWYDHIGLDGQIRSEEHYKDDKKDGKWTAWSESGQIWSEKHYKDDKCISGDC